MPFTQIWMSKMSKSQTGFPRILAFDLVIFIQKALLLRRDGE